MVCDADQTSDCKVVNDSLFGGLMGATGAARGTVPFGLSTVGGRANCSTGCPPPLAPLPNDAPRLFSRPLNALNGRERFGDKPVHLQTPDRDCLPLFIYRKKDHFLFYKLIAM